MQYMVLPLDENDLMLRTIMSRCVLFVLFWFFLLLLIFRLRLLLLLLLLLLFFVFVLLFAVVFKRCCFNILN